MMARSSSLKPKRVPLATLVNTYGFVLRFALVPNHEKMDECSMQYLRDMRFNPIITRREPAALVGATYLIHCCCERGRLLLPLPLSDKSGRIYDITNEQRTAPLQKVAHKFCTWVT